GPVRSPWGAEKGRLMPLHRGTTETQETRTEETRRETGKEAGYDERDETAAHDEAATRDDVDHRDDVVHRDEAAYRDEAALRHHELARRRFGGTNWGACFFGWLVAIALTILLTSIIGAVVAAVGSSTNVTQSDAQRQAGTIGVAAAITLFVVLVIGYYAGG